MSLTFKEYKINHITLLFIKVLTLSQKQVKIQNSMPSIGQTYYSIKWKWRNSSQRFCLIQLILDSCLINRSQHSIGQKEFSIDQDNEGFHHGVSTWLDWFLNPLWSIEKYIRSIEMNSKSIENHIIEFF